MRYREILPAPPLRAHVRCYWFLRDPVPSTGPEPVLPDGSVEWIFHLGAPFLAVENGVLRRQAGSLSVHDLERPISLVPGGEADVVGVRFRPGLAYPFLRIPLAELRGAIWDLEALDAGSKRAKEGLGELRGDEARAGWLDRFLEERLAARRVDEGFDRLIAWMDGADGRIPIGRLASARGVSVRQLERIFLDRVGIGPKRFSRLLRFRRVVREIRAEAGSWLDRAMEAGYFDQSHLIREFRGFAGMTPGELARRCLPLNDLFVSNRDPMSLSSNRDSIPLSTIVVEEGR